MDAGGAAEESRLPEIVRRIALRSLGRAQAWRKPLDVLYYLLALATGAALLQLAYFFVVPEPADPTPATDLRDIVCRAACLLGGAAGTALLLRAYRRRLHDGLLAAYRDNLAAGLLSSAWQAALNLDTAGLSPERAYARQARPLTDLYWNYRGLCRRARLPALPGMARWMELGAAGLEWGGAGLLLLLLWEWVLPPLVYLPALPLESVFEHVAGLYQSLMLVLLPLAPALFYLRRWHITSLLGETLRQIAAPLQTRP